MEYTWDLVMLYRKGNKVNQQTRGLWIEKSKKMFSDIFTIKMTRLFKAINQMRLNNVHNYP